MRVYVKMEPFSGHSSIGFVFQVSGKMNYRGNVKEEVVRLGSDCLYFVVHY